MLDRNKRIKPRPERFQNCRDLFDLILTCEERVYDQVVEGKDVDWAPLGSGVEGEGVLGGQRSRSRRGRATPPTAPTSWPGAGRGFLWAGESRVGKA